MKHSETGRAIAQAILEEYKPRTKEEMQEALKEKWTATLGMNQMTAEQKTRTTEETATRAKR